MYPNDTYVYGVQIDGKDAAHAALSHAQLALRDACRAERKAYARLAELFEAQGHAYVDAALTSETRAEKARHKRGARYSFERKRYYEDMAAQK